MLGQMPGASSGKSVFEACRRNYIVCHCQRYQEQTENKTHLRMLDRQFFGVGKQADKAGS